MSCDRVALIGHPVAHSLSPALHAAAYEALGLHMHYELVDCPDEASVHAAVDALRGGHYLGLNVTLPWKRTALSLADELGPSARRVGAANVLARDGERVLAHNTDLLALVERLRVHGIGRGPALVLGGGGAALAATAALTELGATPWVLARRFVERGARALFAPLGASAIAPGAALDPGAPFRVVVQATSAGMSGRSPGEDILGWIDWDQVEPDALCLDVVYVPARTPFLEVARGRGRRSEGGLEMLIGQAAHSVALWTGRTPPVEAMRRAAHVALGPEAES
ncbi:MAG: shikimate dehydrogenase [Polyangiaceae bacterium]|nr:shikimate dehydrogenase [Polyangiaceae bacterium]